MSSHRPGALRKIARRNHGLFTFDGARQCGYSDEAILHRRRTKAWEVVAPGVLRSVLAPSMTWLEETAAACLSTGGLAARLSACALYGLAAPPPTPELVHVRSRRNQGASTIDLPSHDIALVRNIRATSPTRSVIDACGVLRAGRAAEELIGSAIQRRLVRVERLERRARELWAPRRAGCAVVLRVLAEAHPDLQRSRSNWEQRVIQLCDRFGLPRPAVGYEVVVSGERYFLDLAWPPPLVFSEFDGYEYHRSRAQFDADRARQNQLVAAGWRPVHLTSRNIERSAVKAFAPLQALLAA